MSSHIPIDSSTIISNESSKEFNILRTSPICRMVQRNRRDFEKDYEPYLGLCILLNLTGLAAK